MNGNSFNWNCVKPSAPVHRITVASWRRRGSTYMDFAPLGLGNRELDAPSKGPNGQGRPELDAPSKIRNKSWTLVITFRTRNRSWTLVSKAFTRTTIDATLRIPGRILSRGALPRCPSKHARQRTAIDCPLVLATWPMLAPGSPGPTGKRAMLLCCTSPRC